MHRTVLSGSNPEYIILLMKKIKRKSAHKQLRSCVGEKQYLQGHQQYKTGKNFFDDIIR